MKILITGATGLLGPYMVQAMTRLGMVYGLARKNADICLDLTDGNAITQAIRKLTPNLVVHAAGMTDVDGCEADSETAFLMNAETTKVLVSALNSEVMFIYISTDQVYPNTKGPHAEENASPVNVYGKSKLAGEAYALGHRKSLVLRTNFFGPSKTGGRESLCDFIIRNLEQGQPITLFDDIYFSPLHMLTLSTLIAEMVEKQERGIYNLGSRNGMSKKDFGLIVARWKDLNTSTVKIGKSGEIPARAPRPKDMRLNIDRIERILGREMPTLQNEIEKL